MHDFTAAAETIKDFADLDDVNTDTIARIIEQNIDELIAEIIADPMHYFGHRYSFWREVNRAALEKI